MPAQSILDHGVLRFLTAGSVDDGKSTLIGRLLHDTRALLADQLSAVRESSRRRGQVLDLSLFTDGLVAEREQGITIDVAYRYFGTAQRKFIVADAPGHVQYTRNMVTAASTADVAVLLVDARRGIVAQTRRHAMLAHLLRVPALVVAVNKMDLVGWHQAVFDAIAAEFASFAAAHGIGAAHVVPMSAAEGDMVVDRGANLGWYHGPTLLQLIETIEVPVVVPPSVLRLPVQYVARQDDGSRRYLGRIEAGSLAVGDTVALAPQGREIRVAALYGAAGKALERATAPADVAFAVEGEVDIARGDMLVDPSSLARASRSLEADLCWLGDAPLDTRRTYALRHGTRSVRARVRSLGTAFDAELGVRGRAPDAPGANAIVRATLDLAEPLLVDRYADLRATGRFVLVDEASHDTVAAGMVA